MYACMYACMYVCMYVCMCLCVYTHIHMHIYIYNDSNNIVIDNNAASKLYYNIGGLGSLVS